MALTSIPVYATGDTIEASWANDLRDNFLALDSRTGGDPGASGKVVVSTSATAGSPQVMGESNQLTAPKVSKSGDTMTSDLTFSTAQTGPKLAGGSHLRDDTAGNQMQILVHDNRLILYRLNASAQLADFNDGALTIPGALSATSATLSNILTALGATLSGTLTAVLGVFSSNVSVGGIFSVVSNATVGGTLGVTGLLSGAAAAFSGALSAASGAFVGAVTAASATLSGALNAASAAITNGITAATMTATGLVKGSTLESTVTTGTPPIVVASTTQVANLKASAAALADNASLLGGLATGQSAGQIPTNAGGGFTNVGLDAEFISGFNFASIDVRFSKIKAGAYTGNGSSQTITTGWPPKAVLIFGNSTMAIVLVSGTVFQSAAGVVPSVVSGITFTATAFVPAAAMNLGSTSYTYVAIG